MVSTAIMDGMGCKSSGSDTGNGGNNGRECDLSYPEDCIPSPSHSMNSYLTVDMQLSIKIFATLVNIL